MCIKVVKQVKSKIQNFEIPIQIFVEYAEIDNGKIILDLNKKASIFNEKEQDINLG